MEHPELERTLESTGANLLIFLKGNRRLQRVKCLGQSQQLIETRSELELSPLARRAATVVLEHTYSSSDGLDQVTKPVRSGMC